MDFDINECKGGDYLSAIGLGDQKRTGKIVDVRKERIAQLAPDGEQSDDKTPPKMKTRALVKLEGVDKEWLLNTTNIELLKAMWGKRTGAWIGHRVTIYSAKIKCKFAEEGIRVWGSPDIERDIDVTIALARRRPIVMTLHAVRASRPQSEPNAAPTREPGED